MGYFVGVTSTGFVGTDEMSAVTSYMPCHIFGDQMLIGAGIRIGFYLLYAAGIIAVLFSVDKQFRFWHGAWGILALALLVTMFLNMADYNLIIIDYAVLIQLVLWYPVYFVFTVLFRQALVVDGKSTSKADAEYRERLQRCRQEAVTELDVRRARAYADVLKAFALYAAAEEAERDHDAAQAVLSQAVQRHVSLWHEQIEIRDGQRSEIEEITVDGGAITTVYNTELIEEIAAAPTRADIEKMRDLYVAALIHSERSIAEARATEQEVALIASEELRVKRRARPAKQSLFHFLVTTSYKDQLTAALGLLIWSAWMFGTAALNWPLLHHGDKAGGACDNVPTVYFVFAPKKPFVDQGFTTFLRIWTVGVCLVAVVTTALALFIFTVIIFGPAAVGLGLRRSRKGKRSLESGQDSSARDLHASPGYSRKARGRHAQEILACLHHTDSRSIRHRYRSRTTAPARFSLWSVPWAVLLAVLLVVTIVCAELTVTRQGPNNNVPLDFARPPLHETAEILAFLIGLYTLLLTILSVFGAFVAAHLRRNRRQNSGHGNHHPHQHRQTKEEAQAGKSEQPGVAY